MALSLKEVLDLCTQYGVVRIKASTADAGEVELAKVAIVDSPEGEKKAIVDPEADKPGPDGLTKAQRDELFPPP